jgi:hypothetical protein
MLAQCRVSLRMRSRIDFTIRGVMKRFPFWLTKAALAALLSIATPAFARSGGVAALGCDACHRGGRAPTVTLTSLPAEPAVGQPITLTIGVSPANGSLAGFYLTTANQAPGRFEAVEAGTVATATDVMHTAARAGSGGEVTFKARWTPSEATGVEFDVYAVSANGDRSNQGDGPGTAKLELLVGCTGATYYIDQDEDGYGSRPTTSIKTKTAMAAAIPPTRPGKTAPSRPATPRYPATATIFTRELTRTRSSCVTWRTTTVTATSTKTWSSRLIARTGTATVTA